MAILFFICSKIKLTFTASIQVQEIRKLWQVTDSAYKWNNNISKQKHTSIIHLLQNYGKKKENIKTKGPFNLYHPDPKYR